ncbi:MAG: SMP-30/gluconolactonase/LRE family protein [Acidobacteria bacterium]|nr:SMP-30/gluconolactonase/LRE family protein [Acidobacteriota bacterium]
MLRYSKFLLLFSFILAFIIVTDSQAQIPGIGPVEPVRRVSTGFAFTEGPASDIKGNIYFTDVSRNRIHKLDLQDQLSTFLDDSQGCNGLIFDADEKLIACQGNPGRIIRIDINSKTIQPIIEQFQGKRFDRPNDLVIDRQGGVYFSDPVFSGQMVQDKMGVYYVSSSGQVNRIIDNLSRPNGVILSPDEKTLYVLSGASNVMAYPVNSPGQIGQGRVLVQLQSSSNGDGMTVDSQGNLYLTRPGINAIEVVTPEGRSLGLIQFPEAPSNCTFGGADFKTLYVTARTSVYSAKMAVVGHRFATPISAPGFSIDLDPINQSVSVGMSAQFTVNVISIQGFSQSVSLSATSANNQISAQFSNSSVTPGNSTMLTLNTTSTISPGDYPINIVGRAGSITVTQTATLSVVSGGTAGDFSLSLQPSSQMINAGSSTSFNIGVQAINGFADPINLNATISPNNSNVTSLITSPIISPGATTTITINTTTSTPEGTYNITLTGISGQITRTANVTVSVIGAPDFAVSFQPNSVTINRGQSAQLTLNIARSGGFTGTIMIAGPAAAALKDLKLKLTPETQSSNGNSVSFTIKSKKKSPAGSQTLTFMAMDNDERIRVATFTLILQ